MTILNIIFISLFLTKAEEGLEDELSSSRLCKTRINHITPYAMGDNSNGQMAVWKKTRLNRMLVDHFLREGYYGTATSLAKSADIFVSTNIL